MKNKYIVQIGSADSDVNLVESVPSTEKLIEAEDKYAAHKRAYFDCYLGQEVLCIKDQNNKILYTLKDGFIKQ